MFDTAWDIQMIRKCACYTQKYPTQPFLKSRTFLKYLSIQKAYNMFIEQSKGHATACANQ